MSGKKKSKSSSKGLVKLFGKFWKKHGREMAHNAVDQHGNKVVTKAQQKLQQRDDKYSGRAAQGLDRYGCQGVDMLSSRLAQEHSYQQQPAYNPYYPNPNAQGRLRPTPRPEVQYRR